jgi:HTH-type transcriptional regulator / antitoxin HipB
MAPLSATLRAARLGRGMVQAELAGRLGMRQGQISDLEIGAMDPRVSTVRNVARALDLELVLIPRTLVTAVNALQRGPDAASQPLYRLPRDDDSA